jgi:hypothetical protein
MRRMILGLSLAFLLLAGAPALTSRRSQAQDEKPIPIDDTFWRGTITIETSEKGWSEGWNCTGFRESQRNSKITFTLDNVPRYGDVDQWSSEGASFVIVGSGSELDVCHPEGNYKGMREQFSETTNGSGTAEVLLSSESRGEQEPDKMSISLIADSTSEKVTIKRHWVKTTEDGTKTWDDEQQGSAGHTSFTVPYDPDHAVLSGVKTDRHTYKGEPNPSYWSGEVETTYHYDLRRSRPSDLEAVMIPVGDYDKWWPTAGKNEDEAGPKPLTVKVRLQKKGAPNKPGPKKAKFKFELVDTTREKGICLNWPKKAKESYDLRIEQKLNDELSVTDDKGKPTEGQQAHTKSNDLNESRVTISCFDYGAFARLKVTAILDEGKKTEIQIPAHLESDKSKYELTIPQDKNDNKIADDWEEFNDVQGWPADDDSESDPKGDEDTGDGLTLYEEYRGFMENGKHIWGEPLKKDLFLCNKIGDAVLPGIELFKSITELEVHSKLTKDELGENRVVNRHRTEMAHAVDQHGLLLVRGAERFTSQAVWEEKSKGIIGTPKRYKQVEIATCLLGRMTSSPELDKKVAHELLHCCNVHHHGDADPRNKTIRSEREPNGSYAIRLIDQDKNGNPVGQGKIIWLFKEMGDGLVPCSGIEPELMKGISVYVAAKHGEHSGDVNCVMRYIVAECYINSAGDYVRFEDDEVIGRSLCSQTAGTGVNEAGRKPEPRYGDADKAQDRGKCRDKICVNDKYH